jgi:hypothetical protein
MLFCLPYIDHFPNIAYIALLDTGGIERLNASPAIINHCELKRVANAQEFAA